MRQLVVLSFLLTFSDQTSAQDVQAAQPENPVVPAFTPLAGPQSRSMLDHIRLNFLSLS
jgi:hypothetical protein